MAQADPGELTRDALTSCCAGSGGRASLPTLRQNLGPVYLAGDYLLDMPSLADAANSGQQAAEKVLATLAQRQTLA
ncbi:hypothetical protein [Nocardioides immobilis]|uniref:hypothetical protein n=1 Tax=Nocardioides immobilis TaxID=2049295 RepID=UPI001C714E5E|nr:hypothetical protein [Nocardioides immobilis]